MQRVDYKAAAERLCSADDIWILTHRNPDGDTLGCAFALCAALTAMGKRVNVLCPEPLPDMYSFIYPENREALEFEPRFIVTVDIASPALMGKYDVLAGRVDLSIDHHPSNAGFAKETCLNEQAAATGEIVFDILTLMDAPIERTCADALYLSLSSDTGGFHYANTTAETHRKAARLIDMGAKSAEINRMLFEQKPRGLVAVEAALMADMSYYHDGLCAVMRLPLCLLAENGLTSADVDGLSALPRRVMGVEAGVVLREREGTGWRVSLRTIRISAGDICSRFGGGGHRFAAGCTIEAPLKEAEAALVAAVGEAVRSDGLLP